VIFLNNRIKELRKSKKLSQKDFAENINLSQNHISSIEKGVRTATDRIVNDICNVYKVNKDWLLTGEGKMFIDPLAPFIIEDIEVQEFVKLVLEMDESTQKVIMDLAMKLKKK